MFNIEPVVCSTDGCRVNNACYRSNPGDCVLLFNVGTCNFPSNIRVALHCVLSTALEMIYGNRYTSWNQEVVALWQSQNRTQVCSCPWARWLPVFPKTVQRSQCRLKRGGIVLIWLHYLHLDVVRWKPSWQWRPNKTTTSSFFLAGNNDGYQDVSNTRNGLGKAQGGWAQAFYSTLSSNHLILMLLHCLVNQPSIYINP